MESELAAAADDVGDAYGLTRVELAEQLRLLADWIDPPPQGDMLPTALAVEPMDSLAMIQTSDLLEQWGRRRKGGR